MTGGHLPTKPGPTGSRLYPSETIETYVEYADDEESPKARQTRLLAEARAIAGHEGELETDGGQIIDAEETLENGDAEHENTSWDDLPALHVGDQVSVRGDDGPKVTVVRACSRSAGEYLLEFCDETVAQYNDVDGDEDVYEVVFASRTTKDISDLKRYPYPRSRLKLEAELHDRDGDEGGDAE